MNDTVYLVDGSGYIFRAFYAIQSLTNSDGFPTNALFGFSKMLLKLLAAAKTDHVVVVFDAGRETFRTAMFSEYKANRVELPEALGKQMPFFREITTALGLQTLELKGFEADDLIATISTRLATDRISTVIVSGDKDLMQLVGENVTIWDTMKDKWYRREEVKEKFGVYPEQVVDFLGLTGDSSDNIPGLSGVGPKTAVQLIEKYKDIEGILAASTSIRGDSEIRNRGKIADLIESEAETVRLSRRLAEVDRAVPLSLNRNGVQVLLSEISPEDICSVLVRGAPDSVRLKELAQRFEFGSLLKDFVGKAGASAPVADSAGYRTVLREDFSGWLSHFLAVPEFAFDVETTALDFNEAKLVGVSFCWSSEEAWYVPLAHTSVSPETQISVEEFLSAVRGRFADPSVRKVGQNLKYDTQILERHGVTVEGVFFDTMIADYLLNPDGGAHNLTALAAQHLGRGTIEFEEVLGEAENFAGVGVQAATQYCCQDSHYAWLVKEKLRPEIERQGLSRVFFDIEMPLVTVLARMELRGVRLDTALLGAMSDDFASKLEVLEKEIFQVAGCEFNMNSPKQLAEVLFDKLQLPTKGLKRTKTGTSTDSGVLEKLSQLHPLPLKILEYRGIFKLKSTYVDALPAQISAITGRLHSRFNQAVTGTGRLSSSEPNLQNIPVTTAEGRRVRAAFVPEPGKVLISADYSQIELRVLAHMSGDENLISAFQEGVDVHSKTAREVLDFAEGFPITGEQRRVGKTINFGVVYGMGPYRLSKDLGISLDKANAYIQGYFARYPRVKEFFSRIEEGALRDGFVTTIFGRKRTLSGIDTSDRDKGFVLRAALNAPLQGSAADIIKMAMVRIDRELRLRKIPCEMILQIHDELVFEAEAAVKDDALALIIETMESVVDFKVPLKVDAHYGLNWEEVH